MNGAQVIAEILKREGTEFLAAYPRNALIDACAEIDIRSVLCRQERVGVGIADGFSRIRHGKQNGVFAAQHGPGIENAFAGVAQAYSENVPMLVMPAGFGPERHHQKPTFRAAEVMAPVSKWSTVIYSAKEIPDVMRRAYHAMRTGKGGPVVVEVPNSVFDEEFEGNLDYEPVAPMRYAPDPDAVKKAAEMLLSARSPCLWAGQGVIYAEAGEQLLELASMIPAPIVCTNPGKSAVPDSHPLALGGSTGERSKGFAHYLNKSDVLFAVGSSLTKTSFGPTVPNPTGKKIIHSTNEPSDIHKDYRAALGLVGDARLVLEALIAEVARQRKDDKGKALAALKDEMAAIKKEWLAEWKDQLESDEVPINQYRVINELLKHVDRDNAIVTHDSGSPRKQLLPFWETTRPGSYMGWGKSTQLGYGLGITMGAKLAAPDKFCMNVMGDCSVGMTGMDLETASRNRIGIMTVVFNNSVMACERHVLETATAKYNALDVLGNYAKVAEGLNVASRRVEKPGDIAGAIKEGIDTTSMGQPYLMEIVAKEGYDFSRYQ